MPNCDPVPCDEEFLFNLQSGEAIFYKHKSTLSHYLHDYVANRRIPDGGRFLFNDALVNPVEEGVVFNPITFEGGGAHAETPYVIFLNVYSK